MAEGLEENIFKALNSSGPTDDQERIKFINDRIRGKKSEEIINVLIKTPVEENGGITAISGFYYQFLVALEYIIELLEDKWDFVALELHDDIIVGRDKDVRIIQVKSSYKSTQNPSDVSKLYTREKKKSEDIEYPINNSWIDKIVSKAGFFPKSKGFNTQFQLYTSYHIVRTNQNSFDLYTDNREYNKPIPENDSLYNHLSEVVYDDKLNEYKYDEKCEESIKDLLKRLYLKTGDSILRINRFESYIKDKLGNILFKEYDNENLSLSNEDLKILIGTLCTMCKVGQDTTTLIITKDKIQEVLEPIKERIISDIGTLSESHYSKKIIDKAVDSLMLDFNELKHYEQIRDLVVSYKTYLTEWLDNGGNLRELINRYIDGINDSPTYFSLNEGKKIEKIKEAILLVSIVNLVNGKILNFVNNNWLLTKEKESNYWFMFLGVNNTNFKSAKQKIMDIFETTHLEESLNVQLKDISLILQGYRDSSFQTSTKEEFQSFLSIDSNLQELSIFNEPKLNKVSLTIKIIPGKLLEESLFEFLNEEVENFSETIDSLKDVWKRLEA